MSEKSLPNPIVVQKFGGTSLGSVEAIRRAAQRVVDTKREGCRVVVVVSAMGDSTDHLLELAGKLDSDPPRRELDVLLGTGECVSTSLLSMAIHSLGEEAVSLTGAQCGVFTNEVHSNARILEVRPQRILRELAAERIVVAAGFQGVTYEQELTTLGRGGSDTSAVALAAALGAERCEIFTDVDGVYSADPRIVPRARRIQQLSAEEMEELAWHGAQVLKAEAVEFANSNAVALQVGSSFADNGGTWVLPAESGNCAAAYRPHRPEVAGVAGRRDLLHIKIDGSVFSGGRRSEIFQEISSYDLVFGGVDAANGGFDLWISTAEIPNADAFRRDLGERFPGVVRVDDRLGAVSLVGFGLGSRPGSFFDVIRTLEQNGIRVLGSFTGRESLSFVVALDKVDEGMRLLHRCFVENVDTRERICSA